jgi:hypothetical protein
MRIGYGYYRDQVVDEAVGVGNKVSRTNFDVQGDGALAEDVLQEGREETKTN